MGNSVYTCALPALLLVLVSSAAAPQPPSTAGDLIIIGGGFAYGNEAVWNRIVSTRLPGKPIGVIGTASYEPRSSGEKMCQEFNAKFGQGTAIYVDVTDTKAADDPLTSRTILSCGGFYFTGGVQNRVITTFCRHNGEPTLALKALLQVYHSGGCIAGSSAGAAIMSDPMILGGTSEEALFYGVVSSQSREGVGIGKGLGFYPGAMFDQHHLSRGRLGRLIIATMAAGFTRGYGIDNNTALAIDNQSGWAEVIGEMGVLVVDVSHVVQQRDGSKYGMVLHYLDIGDRIHMVSGEVDVGNVKSPITAPQFPAAPVTSHDIWNDYEVWRVVTTLVDTQGAEVARGTDPYFDVLFRKTPQTRAWRGGTHSYGNTRPAYTVLNIEVAVVPRGAPFPKTSSPGKN